MPKSDENAKRWQSDLAARFGRAVQTRRQHLGLSVAQIADHTAELGYPIHRVALGKIESNNRSGKVDLAEVVVLARALDVPAIELLFPPDVEEVAVLPAEMNSNYVAVKGFAGSEFYTLLAELSDETKRFAKQVSRFIDYRRNDQDETPDPLSGATQAELAAFAADAARATAMRIETLYEMTGKRVWPGPMEYEGFKMGVDIVNDAPGSPFASRPHPNA